MAAYILVYWTRGAVKGFVDPAGMTTSCERLCASHLGPIRFSVQCFSRRLAPNTTSP